MTMYDDLAVIFRDVLDDETISLKPELTANDVERWDSVSHIRLMIAIEEHYGFRFSSKEISGLKNVGELVAVIERKLKT